MACRRSCFAFVEIVCQLLYLTKARTAAAKTSGQLLYVEGKLSIARNQGYPIRRGKSGSRWPLTSVFTLSQALDCSHFVSWDRLYGYAQTHQKSPKNPIISTKQTGYNSIKFFAQLSFKKARLSFPPLPHSAYFNKKSSCKTVVIVL